jgi:hypothetical protein
MTSFLASSKATRSPFVDIQLPGQEGHVLRGVHACGSRQEVASGVLLDHFPDIFSYGERLETSPNRGQSPP